MTTHSPPESPVLTLRETARYVRRSENALKLLRHKGRGPAGFLQEGRLMYFLADVDAWLASGAASDARYNPAISPTRVPAQASRPRKKKTAPRTTASAAA